MQELRAIEVENGALIVASEDGTRYRVEIDDALRSTLRSPTAPSTGDRKVAPREIQSQIRAGMSAEDVASVTGASLDYIRKFEGPVLAEREFVVESALAISVHTAIERDPMSPGTSFGAAIRERLLTLNATNERWASWKEIDGGWIVKLAFTSEEIDHDARWRFDPKKAALAPLNNEAITLSQQGDLTGSLIPRLRAVGGDERVADASRFDSGAFSPDELDGYPGSTRGAIAKLPSTDESSPAVSAAAINRELSDEAPDSHQTADLLEALRRRRGEREEANFEEDVPSSAHPSLHGVRLVDVPLDGYDEPSRSREPHSTGNTAPQATASPGKQRKGRAAMPSWDDIVFGARPDDED